eukprot:6444509-Amphidinium_carterae.1
MELAVVAFRLHLCAKRLGSAWVLTEGSFLPNGGWAPARPEECSAPHHGARKASTEIATAQIRGSARSDLADAIADNIVFVAIRQRASELGDGDLYRENLPKAIVEVTSEHGRD